MLYKREDILSTPSERYCHRYEEEPDMNDCSHCDAREIGNFEHCHHKGRKTRAVSCGTKPGGPFCMDLLKMCCYSWKYQRQCKYRLQHHATVEAMKNKSETWEDEWDNHHDDPGFVINANWYKMTWRKLKKQAKKIASFKADTDSSSDESMSIDSLGSRRPLDSTQNNFEEDFVSNEASEGVEVNNESQKRDKYRKLELSAQAGMILESNNVYINPLTPAVSSHVSIPNQVKKVLSEGKADTKSAGQVAVNKTTGQITDTKCTSHITGTKTADQITDTKPPDQIADTKSASQLTGTKSASQITGTKTASQCTDTKPAGTKIAGQITEIKPAGRIADTKSASQITETNTIGQITDTKPAGQIADTKHASQITGTKIAGQITEIKPAGQIADTESASQVTKTKPAGQIADTKHASHIADREHASQITGTEIAGQITEIKCPGQTADTKSASQVTETKPAGQIADTKHASQIADTKRASQITGTEIAGQVTETKPASQIADTKSASQISRGTQTAGQVTETKPASQIADTKIASQVTETKIAGQIADTKSASQVTETKTAGQITKTKPAGQIADTKCASQITGTKPVCQITNSKSASQIIATKTEGQITDTKPAGQIIEIGSASQITDTKPAGQIRELLLEKEEHQAERQKAQIEVGGMPEILKDTENEKNEKHSYVNKFGGKDKQDKEFVACSKTKYIVQLKAEEIAEDASDRGWHGGDRNVRLESTGTSEGSANRPIHRTDICSDDHYTTYDSQEDSRIGMPGHSWYKVPVRELKKQAKRLTSSEADTDSSSDESLSCFARKSDSMERKAKNHHPSDCPNKKETCWQRQDMQRASRIERQSVRKTATHRKAQASKDKKNAEWRVNIKNQINALPEETRSTLFCRSALIYPEHATSEEGNSVFERFESNPVLTEDSGDGPLISNMLDQFETTGTPDSTEEGPLELILVLCGLLLGHKTRRYDVEEKLLKVILVLCDLLLGHKARQYDTEEKLLENSMDHYMLSSKFADEHELTTTDVMYLNLNGNFLTLFIWLMVGLLMVVFVSFIVILMTCMVKGLRRKMIEPVQLPINSSEILKNIEPVQLPINSSEILKNVKNAAAKERSKHESVRIKLYRNVMRNEMCRMMTCIDIVVSEAKQLFGLERTQIFFDLLDDSLFHFGSAGAISEFVPNMAKSSVRKHVISFFEYAFDIMNRLVTLLLRCPDSKQLQQIQEQNFVSLMWTLIGSSLKSEGKEGKRIYSKGTRFIMVDLEEFQRALGNDIPEEVLDRLRHGDELVVHSFVDTGLERTQASERRVNVIYFPSACRLFIYIPTEKGSYWHQLDLQRVNRIN